MPPCRSPRVPPLCPAPLFYSHRRALLPKRTMCTSGVPRHRAQPSDGAWESFAYPPQEVVVRGQELTAHFARMRRSQLGLASAALLSTVMAAGMVVATGGREVIKERVVDNVKERAHDILVVNVKERAHDILTVNKLQDALCAVSNCTFHNLVDRFLSDPRTTEAAIEFLVKVLEKPGVEDASRRVALSIVEDAKTVSRARIPPRDWAPPMFTKPWYLTRGRPVRLTVRRRLNRSASSSYGSAAKTARRMP
jgi:hypothetical protein